MVNDSLMMVLIHADYGEWWLVPVNDSPMVSSSLLTKALPDGSEWLIMVRFRTVRAKIGNGCGQ